MKNPDDSSSKMFVLAIVAIVVVGIGAIAFFAVQRNSAAVAEDQKVGAFTADGVEFPAQVSEEEFINTVQPQALEIALPPYQQGVPDAAIGEVAPELSGTDFAGNVVEIKADGKPKVLYFLAHWCGACVSEIPEIQEMLDEGLLPEGLDIYSISSRYQAGAGNSPEIWLDREEWTPPVLRDNQTSTAFNLYGDGGTPYFVYLDGENKVVYRSSGAIGRERTLALWQQAAEGTLRAASVQPTPQAESSPNPNATTSTDDSTATSAESTASTADSDEGATSTTEETTDTSVAASSSTIG